MPKGKSSPKKTKGKPASKNSKDSASLRDQVKKHQTSQKTDEDSATILVFQCTNCGDEIEKLERCPHCDAPLKLLTTIDTDEVDDLDGIDGAEETSNEGDDESLDTILEDKLDDDPPSIDDIANGDENSEEPIVPDDDLDKIVDPQSE